MDSSTQEILIKVGADIADLSRGMRDAQEQIRGLGKASETAGSGGALSLGKLAGAIGLVAGASKVFGMIKDSISSAFGRIDTMESFERVMTTLTGSTEKTKEALDKTRDAVTGTAYGLDVAAKGVQDFVTRGMEVSKATDTMAAWGDAVAFYGDGSNEQLANVSDALAKMVSSGKVGMDQMNRLYDAGIDGVGMYAQATGRDVNQVQKDLSSGKITAEDFIDTVTKAMMEGTNGVTNIAGAAKEAGASWNASFDNMKAAVTRGVVDVIQTIDRMLTENGLPDMRTMVAEFGSKFEEVIKKAAAAIPPMVEKIQKVVEVLKPWAPLLTAIGLAIATFVITLATVNTGVKIFTAVKKAMVALNVVMAANPAIIWAAAIVGLAYLIYKYWDEIKAVTIAVWTAISDFFVGLWDGIVSVATSAWTGFLDFMTGLWQSIKDTAAGAWDGLVDGVMSVVDSIVSKWQSFVAIITGVWNMISAVAGAAWTAVYDRIMAVVNPIVEYVQTQFQAVVTGIQGIFGGLGEYFSGIWTVIKNIFLGAILLITQLITGDFAGMKDSALQIMQNIRDGISQAWEGIKSAFSAALTMVSTVLSNAFNAMKSIVTAVMSAIKSGVTNAWNAIKAAVINVMNAIKSGVTNAWNATKAAVVNSINAIKTGAINGFNAIKNGVINAMSAIKSGIINAWNAVKSAISTAISTIKSTVVNGFNSLKGAVTTAMSGVKNAIVNGWNGAVSFLKGINLATIGRQIIQGLANGIRNAVGLVKDAVKGAADAITGKIKGILGIKSPSRVMAQIGMYTGQGLANGILGMKRKIESASAQMASWATPDTPDVAVASYDFQAAGNGTGGFKAEQEVNHTISERDSQDTKPAEITLVLGGREYTAFVEDIDGTIKRQERLKRKTTRGE